MIVCGWKSFCLQDVLMVPSRCFEHVLVLQMYALFLKRLVFVCFFKVHLLVQ